LVTNSAQVKASDLLKAHRLAAHRLAAPLM
jgi:hypothetical protein